MEIINVKSTPPDTDINSTLNFSDHHNSSNNNVNYIGVGHQSVEIERECTCETIGKCEVHYEHYY